MSDRQYPSLTPFLDYLRYEKRYSAHTMLAYRRDLETFLEYMSDQFGVKEPGGVTHHFIRSWLAALREEGLTARTLNRKISTLKSFYKFSLKRGDIMQSPMTRVISPKQGKKLPSFVREEDTAALIEALERVTEDWKSLNAKLLINFLYSTGMRISELLNLRPEQLDLEKGQVRVLGKGRKERIIPISRHLAGMAGNYLQEKKKQFESPDEKVFLVTEKGKKIYPRYAWLLVNTYLGQTSTLDKKSPHVLRHTFATHLMNHGAGLNAVKELLGHSSLAATQVYTHNSIEKLKDIHKNAHPKA